MLVPTLRRSLLALLLASSLHGLQANELDPFEIYPAPKHRFDAMNEAEQSLRQLNFAQATEILINGEKEERGLKRRAKPLHARIDAVQSVFDGLATRDQLSRELSAHPLCVEITIIGGEKRLGVPVAAPNDAAFADTDRPASYLKRKLEQNGRAYILTDKGAVETLIDGKCDDIVVADSASIRDQKAQEFSDRWARMQEGDLLNDPINWYEAAKFAYRWSLDDWVVPLVEEALKRKNDLVLAVQEDLATDYLTKVVETIDRGDRGNAGRWLGQMRKHFPKTMATKQAAALYNNDQAAMKAAVQEAEKEEQTVVAQKPQPTKAASQPKAKPVSQPKPEPAPVIADTKPVASDALGDPQPATSSKPTGPVAPDRKKADDVFADANKKLAEAQNMLASKKRDVLYKKAEELFSKAKGMYAKLGADDMVLKANLGRYSCKKMRRF
jgi:hypothetical protein